ncbi:WD40-repeat-containing domain protein [Fennellomyces sp. T-0311]|nr:WD40-repeat-containing domain protein [Fennellomyces sp. T-0311]
MESNQSPLSAIQLTSPLPSPSATPGRPVMDDQGVQVGSGNDSINLVEGSGNNNNNSRRRDGLCLQLPPVVPATHLDNDRLVPCQHRRSFPPLVFNPPLTHGDASLYPLANIPTPSMLQQLSFTMPGARGILEEVDSPDGQVAVRVSSDTAQGSNHSPRKRPVSWFSKEEDWETNFRSSKRTDRATQPTQEASGEIVDEVPVPVPVPVPVQQSSSSEKDDGAVAGDEQQALFSSFASSMRSPLLPGNSRAPSDTPTSPYAMDNADESPNSALPSPSLSPVSSGAQDIVWSQADNSHSPEMIPLDKQPTQAVVPPQAQHPPPPPAPSLPARIFDTYARLPQNIQNYFLVHLLRRSPMSALRLANSAILQALRMDIIARLPSFLAHRILRLCDFRSLCRATAVSRQWHQIIDGDAELWQLKFAEAGYAITSDEAQMYSNTSLHEAQVYKELYRRHYRMQLNWKYNRSKRLQLTGHPNNVVTCLQFDDDKIITGSDDHSVNIYDIKTGKLRLVLEGHDGGVWALQYVGNTLVTGSTDRTIRVWDIDTGRCRHIFRGHMSTVRCLTIVMPTRTRAGHMEPQRPMLVSGSRDTTLQVWMLPTADQHHEPQLQRRIRHSVMPLNTTKTYPMDEPMPNDSDDPMSADWSDATADYPGASYHVHTLTGHTMSVRDLAAHGNILASGSYDNTVRLWHLEMGQLRHVLVGHEQKVYSVVIDAKRNRCISGSMDSTVRIWNIMDGSCLHVLGGHTILVGLLGLTDNYLVSAAADQTLRVWSPDDGERQHVLIGHQGAITSFQHDERKVVSGSEGGLKMWDIKTGKLQHDLITNVSGVWRVAFDERRCVAAVKCADNITRLEVLDYGVVGLD